jgi:hypothetical protein
MYAHITYSVANIFIFSVTTIMNGDFNVLLPLYDYPFELELRKCIMTKKDAFSISPTGVFWVFFWKPLKRITSAPHQSNRKPYKYYR